MWMRSWRWRTRKTSKPRWVAKVTEEKRLVMRWNGRVIVDVSREFLNSNGAPKQATALVEAQKALAEEEPAFAEGLRQMAGRPQHVFPPRPVRAL